MASYNVYVIVLWIIEVFLYVQYVVLQYFVEKILQKLIYHVYLVIPFELFLNNYNSVTDCLRRKFINSIH